MALIDMKSDLSKGVGSKQTPQSFLDGHSATLVTGQKSFGEPPRIIPAPPSLSALSRQSEQLNFKFNDTFNTTSIVKSTKDTLDTYYARAFSQTDPLGARQSKVFGPDEPFVLKEIGDRWGPGRAGVIDFGLMRAGAVTQVARTAADVIRLGKFAITPRGVAFAAKQVILQKQNAANFYGPGFVENLFKPKRQRGPTGQLQQGTDIRTWRPTSIIDSLPIGFHSVRHSIPAGSPLALLVNTASNFIENLADGTLKIVGDIKNNFPSVMSDIGFNFSEFGKGLTNTLKEIKLPKLTLGNASSLTSFFPGTIDVPVAQSPNFSDLKNMLGGLMNQAKDLFGGIQLPNISLPPIPNFPKVSLPNINLSPVTNTFSKMVNVVGGILPNVPKFTGRGGLGIGASLHGNPFIVRTKQFSNPTFHYDLRQDDENGAESGLLTNIYSRDHEYVAIGRSNVELGRDPSFGLADKSEFGIIPDYVLDKSKPEIKTPIARSAGFLFGRMDGEPITKKKANLNSVLPDSVINIPTSVSVPKGKGSNKLEKYNLLTYGQLNQDNSYGSQTKLQDANVTRGIGHQGGDARIVSDGEMGVRMSTDGKYVGGNQDKLNLHPYGGTTASDVINDNSTDFVPLKFRDMVNGKWMIFRAILESVTDTSSPEFSEERYIGRPEKVYAYQGATRNVNITFKVMPKSVQELITLWEKLNYLRGLSYPSIKENRMVAPFFNFTLGDMFDKQPMFFSSLNYTIDTASTWEIKPGLRLPKLIQISADMRFIDKQLPTTTGKHYDLDWLKADGEFGTFDEDPSRATQVMPPHQKYGDLWSELKIVDDDVMDILLAGDEAAEALKETIDLLKSDPKVAGVDFPNPVSAFLK